MYHRSAYLTFALKLVFGAMLLAASVLALASLAGLLEPPVALGWVSTPSTSKQVGTSSLAEYALGKVLDEASPIFGHYVDAQSDTSTWMSRYPDSTQIVHMNIPGTHDAATWNYSRATQKSLHHITKLVDDAETNPTFYRCQDNSIIDMLNAGIRAFDLRYAFDVTKSKLTFWHGPALQSEIATVDDVLFGFYQWLDDHSSEAVLLSLQYEGSKRMGNVDDATVQLQLYNTLTSPAAKKYVLQRRGSFGTLGEARGRITLLRRFTLDHLPSIHEESIPGIHFPPASWTVNSASTTLVYNQSTGGIAYIEDYYKPLTAWDSSAEQNIQSKLDATVSHLRRATTEHTDSLFWTFASSTNVDETPPKTPRILALGNRSMTPEGGVNQRLIPLLRGMKGKRLGIVMFDFFEKPAELLSVFLGFLPPVQDT